MTAKGALKEEITKRSTQLDKLREALQPQLEEDSEDARAALGLLSKVELSLVGADAALEQGRWDHAFYLFAQACWNLGRAHEVGTVSP